MVELVCAYVFICYRISLASGNMEMVASMDVGRPMDPFWDYYDPISATT